MMKCKQCQFRVTILLGLFVIAMVGTTNLHQVYSDENSSCLNVVTTSQGLNSRHAQQSFTALELDPTHGKAWDSASTQWQNHSDFPDSVISPDGRYIAFSYLSGEQRMLMVRAIYGLDPQPGNIIRSDSALNLQSIFWSHGNLLLGYTWQDEKGIHLSISDLQHEQHPVLLPGSDTGQVKILNFSADDRYVASEVTNGDTSQETLTIWSVPDLHPIYTFQVDKPDITNSFIAAQWSPTEDSLAFIAKDKSGTALFNLPLSESQQKITSLTDGLETAVVDLEWSPHGRYITLQGHPPTATIDGIETLDMVNVQSHVLTTVSQQVMEEQGEGVLVSLTHWSPDGNHLYFSQYNHSPILAVNRDLMVYDFATQQVSVVRRNILTGDYLKNPNWLWVAYYNLANGVTDLGNAGPAWQEDLIDMRNAKPIPMIDNTESGINVLESPDDKAVLGWFATSQQWGIRWLTENGNGMHQITLGHQTATPTSDNPNDLTTPSSTDTDQSGINESQWSNNSQFVTFEANHDIGLLDIKTGMIQTIPAQAENWPEFRAFPSDDGNWVAVFYGDNGQLGGNSPTTFKILSSDGKQVYTVYTDATDLKGTASWSPDNQWLGLQRQDSVDILRPDSSIALHVPYPASGVQELVWQPCGG